jgi:hypothetical protein
MGDPSANAGLRNTRATGPRSARSGQSGKGATRIKILVLCRPAAGVDPATAFPPHLPAERDALRELRERGVLTEAYSPGGPGAILILTVPDLAAAHAIAQELPLAAAALIDVELIPLQPIQI